MKKMIQKSLVCTSVLLLFSQYGLGMAEAVHAEQTEEPTVAQQAELRALGIPGPLKFAIKFLGKQALKQLLLEYETHTETPMISSMSTAALRLTFPNKMIFRELDQIKRQLNTISIQLENMKTTMNMRFAELNIRLDIDSIDDKRTAFHKLGDNYKTLSNSYDAALTNFEAYSKNSTGENYQKFYNSYVALTKLLGEDNQAEELNINFQDDLAQLLSLLSPTRSDGADQHKENYLYDVQTYAGKTFVFRHQAYDLMASSYEEIVSYALNYLMTYRTYTTVRVEDKRNQIYRSATQKERTILLAEIETLKTNYENASTELIKAIEASAEYYLVPIMDNQLRPEEKQTSVTMDYKSSQDRYVDKDNVFDYHYWMKAFDTAKVENFYRVQPIGMEISENQPFGSKTDTYYILNHGTGDEADEESETAQNIHRHRVYGLWDKDKFGINQTIYFPTRDFFNLTQTKDPHINAKLMPNVKDYEQLFNMPSYDFSGNHFTDHLANRGELLKQSITGPMDKWLLNYYLDPSKSGFGVEDGSIGLFHGREILKEKANDYSSKDYKFQVRKLSEKPYADEPDDDEPYLVILKGQAEEAYTIGTAGDNANLITIDAADADRISNGKIRSGAPINVNVNLPEARVGYKHQITRLVITAGGVEQELYSNQIEDTDGGSTDEDTANTMHELFEVPTEYTTTMPYNDAQVSVEYEEIKEAYDVNIVTANDKGTLLPGYASFVTTSYLGQTAEFEEMVEINVSPLEGYVATGIAVTAIDANGNEIPGSSIPTETVPLADSGAPSSGGGAFRFQMPANQVRVTPVYEKGVVVDLKTDPAKVADDEVVTLKDQYLWDTNMLDDEFNEDGTKKVDIITRGTYKKQSVVHFSASSSANHILKNIIARRDGSGAEETIALNASGDYQWVLPNKSFDHAAITASYLGFNGNNTVVLEKTGDGVANFALASTDIEDHPFEDGEIVNVTIKPGAQATLDKKAFTIKHPQGDFDKYELKQEVAADGNYTYQLTFAKPAGTTYVTIPFTKDNLICLEANNGGTLRFEQTDSNREVFESGAKVQIKVDPIEHFIKENIQILAGDKEVVAPADVSYDGDVLTFTKPLTAAIITVKGDFEQAHEIKKESKELGEGQNDFQILNANKREISQAYVGDKLKVEMTDAAKAKVYQLRVIGQKSNEVIEVDVTKDLSFTMPDEPITVEASFNNQADFDNEDQPSQDKDGNYILKTYENFAHIGKLMGLPIENNPYRNADYVLDRIVDFKDQPWMPWGIDQQGNKFEFTGTLNGEGFSILNLNNQDCGFINTIGEQGVVKNLGVLSAKFSGTGSYHYSGIIAGMNKGTVDNVFTGLSNDVTHVRVNEQTAYQRDQLNLTVTQNSSTFGGVVGLNYGTIKNTTNYMTIKSDPTYKLSGIGGIAGILFSGSMTNSSNLGTIDVSTANIGQISGGLVGNITGTNVVLKNNYSYSDTSGAEGTFKPISGGDQRSRYDMATVYFGKAANPNFDKRQGTPMEVKDMQANAFTTKLNAGIDEAAGDKKWNRKDNRNDQFPFLESGHIFVNLLSKQALSAGIFTVTTHVPYDTELNLTNKLKAQDQVAAFKAAVKSGTLEKVVDLKLVHPEVEVKAYKEAEIKIDVTKFEQEGAEKRNFKLLHDNQGTIEEVELVREDHTLIGKVDSLSPFALVSADADKEIELDTDNLNNKNNDSSQTNGKNTGGKEFPLAGDKPATFLTVIGLALCAVAAAVWYKKKRA